MSMRHLVNNRDDLVKRWEVEPLLSTSLPDMQHVLSVGLIEAAMSQGVRSPYFRMVKDGSPLDPGSYTKNLGSGASAVAGLPDNERLSSEFAAGATLVLQGLRLWQPAVDIFCAEVTKELHHPVHANAYLTPPRSRGAGEHYDFHSVFIRQLEGSKTWRLREAPEVWPRSHFDRRMSVDTPVLLEVDLQPGDCLYVPRGVVHDGWTDVRHSLHLTVSMVDPASWLDHCLSLLTEKASAELPNLRRILPPFYQDGSKDLQAEAQDALRGLTSVLVSITSAEVAALAEQAFPAEAALPDPPARLRQRAKT